MIIDRHGNHVPLRRRRISQFNRFSTWFRSLSLTDENIGKASCRQQISTFFSVEDRISNTDRTEQVIAILIFTRLIFVLFISEARALKSCRRDFSGPKRDLFVSQQTKLPFDGDFSNVTFTQIKLNVINSLPFIKLVDVAE